MIYSILFFTGAGIAAGVVLTIAAKFLRVSVNETVKRLTEELPGINCGACGYASCSTYAAQIEKGNAAPNLCKPGGDDTAARIGAVLGTEVAAAEPEVAFVHCRGVCGEKYDYAGTHSCRASEMYYNGKEQCRFGCAGLGDCVAACPQDAITIGDNRRAIVAYHKCNACGLCAKACPKNLIVVEPVSQVVHVACSSKAPGKEVREICRKGCIGCKICVKKCPHNAVFVSENLARINNDLCKNCGICAEACPAKCITIVRECNLADPRE